MDAKEEARIKEARKKIIGMGILDFLREHPNETLHIVYKPHDEDDK